jgi:hypothetical protein
VAVGPPPQFSRIKGAFRGSTVALAFVGQDAAAPERDRNDLTSEAQPTLAGISGFGANPDPGERVIARA